MKIGPFKKMAVGFGQRPRPSRNSQARAGACQGRLTTYVLVQRQWRGLGVTRSGAVEMSGVWGGSPRKLPPQGRLFWGACSGGSLLKVFGGVVEGTRRAEKKLEMPLKKNARQNKAPSDRPRTT
jgi:hypothetical protein